MNEIIYLNKTLECASCNFSCEDIAFILLIIGIIWCINWGSK